MMRNTAGARGKPRASIHAMVSSWLGDEILGWQQHWDMLLETGLPQEKLPTSHDELTHQGIVDKRVPLLVRDIHASRV